MIKVCKRVGSRGSMAEEMGEVVLASRGPEQEEGPGGVGGIEKAVLTVKKPGG